MSKLATSVAMVLAAAAAADTNVLASAGQPSSSRADAVEVFTFQKAAARWLVAALRRRTQRTMREAMADLLCRLRAEAAAESNPVQGGERCEGPAAAGQEAGEIPEAPLPSASSSIPVSAPPTPTDADGGASFLATSAVRVPQQRSLSIAAGTASQLAATPSARLASTAITIIPQAAGADEFAVAKPQSARNAVASADAAQPRTARAAGAKHEHMGSPAKIARPQIARAAGAKKQEEMRSPAKNARPLIARAAGATKQGQLRTSAAQQTARIASAVKQYESKPSADVAVQEAARAASATKHEERGLSAEIAAPQADAAMVAIQQDSAKSSSLAGSPQKAPVAAAPPQAKRPPRGAGSTPAAALGTERRRPRKSAPPPAVSCPPRASSLSRAVVAALPTPARSRRCATAVPAVSGRFGDTALWQVPDWRQSLDM